ncbi:hypothetical protein GCM10011504_28780 [Siccirubricoccus deserti]|uniref:Uncharacterized protein n=1 Tax=Siccirubricoccus deserti TaxID=2013562 RepID=A0A9X0QYS8_9PROT|nr:hypothetical protein [Siccirubricoccus deserti]MBC4016486.1 hypothetical protein [Siccirubricoccus deserti]GGC48581.1 hypothetical protein GCM10011504_28780 [Siccirubricoccus deserti]
MAHQLTCDDSFLSDETDCVADAEVKLMAASPGCDAILPTWPPGLDAIDRSALREG